MGLLDQGIEIITGFTLFRKDPLDFREKVENETERLALEWPFIGLIVTQKDDKSSWKYVGDETTNILSDWEPLGAEGAVGPQGPQGDPGPQGPAGIDGQADIYATNSTDTIAIPETHPTTVNLNVDTDLSYTIGQQVIVANSDQNYFTGLVTGYDPVTGSLGVSSSAHVGTGSFSVWEVNLTGAPGKAGKALIHSESDITLNDAKIASVEAGTYTPQNPYSASIFADSRGSLAVPSSLSGDKTGHSISFDGTNWYDNGVWRGPQGPKGQDGKDGTTPENGKNGEDGLNVQVFTGSSTPTGTIREGDVWLPGA